jgi:hypothetical protein
LMLSRRRHVLGNHVSGPRSTALVAIAAIVSSVLPVLYVVAR